MHKIKPIVALVLLSTIGSVHFLSAVNYDQDFLGRAQRQAQRHDKIDEELDNMAMRMMNTATTFYGDLAGASIEAIKEDAKANTEIRTAQALAKANALKGAAIAHVVMKSLTNGTNLTKISASVVVGSAGVAGCYFGAKLGFNYLNALIGKPTLIRETSIRPKKDQCFDFILGRKPAPSRFNEIILDSTLDFKLKEIADTLEMGIADGEGVRHILLTGPAGTGKTMFAKAVAMRLNQRNIRNKGKKIPVNYAICAGADFAQFAPGEDIAEIHKIVDFALKAEGITILFIDEIDSLLKNRLDPLATEASINRTNTFLSIFDKPTHEKIVVIGATNFEHKIDRAAFSRFSKKIAFGLPTGETLHKLFDQYLQKEVLSKKITCDDAFIAHKDELVASLNGLNPRTIEDITGQMYTRVRFLRTTVLTYDIAKSLIKEAHEANERNNTVS